MVKVAEKMLKRNPDSIAKYFMGEKGVLTLCYLARVLYIIFLFLFFLFEFD